MSANVLLKLFNKLRKRFLFVLILMSQSIIFSHVRMGLSHQAQYLLFFFFPENYLLITAELVQTINWKIPFLKFST